ncbi:type II toxin-antitoxin system HipA family toxin [Pseudoxanthomonas kaohsiungensis]|uniref:Type II toxin-antitoxin system HipA family toxin n=1 Tax=Pseudoxanthomonas kaohsiungensis TaxID=283923 RepID=A0ABW3LYA8_9GAMM|nr:HipA domain-containing protein [Pseudoxanthomonas kaohsiungensis]KAF1702861.1 hypothetical protein CSC66_08800 [Pseudoxanthomonas kaohsiungensis]
MDSQIEIHLDGEWRAAGTLSVFERTARFEYLPEYVFGHPAPPPVALSLPVSMSIERAGLRQRKTPLAFLWDLVPQGRGRQHLANLLDVSDQDPDLDLFLAQHGAFAPIGRLRLSTAVAFYEKQTAGIAALGFTIEDMIQRTGEFLDQLAVHGMLAAGTPGVQGVAPKFLLTQDADGRWFPDAALPDERARQHWLVKLPRGRAPEDLMILRHEAIYLQVAAASGLRSIQAPRFNEGMLFLPRFDRELANGRVERVHQETVASLMGAAGFGRTGDLFEITERLASVTTSPEVEVGEFLCRDVLNRALRNTDNHMRNTSVQQLTDGTVQLAPLYDFGPMFKDPELINRTCNWSGLNGGSAKDWGEILERLKLDDGIKHAAAERLHAFGEQQLPKLEGLLRDHDADQEIIDACLREIEHQARQLSEIGNGNCPKP